MFFPDPDFYLPDSGFVSRIQGSKKLRIRNTVCYHRMDHTGVPYCTVLCRTLYKWGNRSRTLKVVVLRVERGGIFLLLQLILVIKIWTVIRIHHKAWIRIRILTNRNPQFGVLAVRITKLTETSAIPLFTCVWVGTVPDRVRYRYVLH